MRRGDLVMITTVIAAIYLVIVLPMALLLSAPSCSQAPKETMANTIVRVVPSKARVEPGEQFQMDIRIEPVAGANIAGLQLDLGFNTLSLQVDGVDEGDFLGQGGAATFFQSGTVDNAGGNVKRIWGAVLGAGEVLPNAGVFVSFQCTAVNGGTTSAFSLTNVIIGNKDGQAVPFDLSTAQVDVILSGDLNLDGAVDIDDFEVITANWGTTGSPGFIDADMKKDGVINVLDAILLGQKIA